jgi:hypothetical protein
LFQTDFGEKSNFAATHLQINKTLDACDKTCLSRENLVSNAVKHEHENKLCSWKTKERDSPPPEICQPRAERRSNRI